MYVPTSIECVYVSCFQPSSMRHPLILGGSKHAAHYEGCRCPSYCLPATAVADTTAYSVNFILYDGGEWHVAASKVTLSGFATSRQQWMHARGLMKSFGNMHICSLSTGPLFVQQVKECTTMEQCWCAFELCLCVLANLLWLAVPLYQTHPCSHSAAGSVMRVYSVSCSGSLYMFSIGIHSVHRVH